MSRRRTAGESLCGWLSRDVQKRSERLHVPSHRFKRIGGNVSGQASPGNSEINITGSYGPGNTLERHVDMLIYIFMPQNANLKTFFRGVGVFESTSLGVSYADGVGKYDTVAAVDGVQIISMLNTMEKGRITLYGVKHS
jgi:hypothetical protein